MVINYMNDRENIFYITKIYRANTISFYNTISKLIMSKDSIPENMTYNAIKDLRNLNDILGNYKLKETVNTDLWNNTIEIIAKENQLFLSIADADDIEVLWYDRSIFIDERKCSPLLVIFHRSKNGELYISRGANDSAIFEKTKD